MRMSEAGAQVIGYKKAVLLPLEVVPKDAGRPVRLEIALEYGICQDICIPVTTTLALSLPPGRTARKGDAIETALERVPRAAAQRRKTDPQLKRVARVEDKAGTRLEIDVAFPGDARGADVFIEAPDGLYVPFARRVGEDAGVVRYAVALGPDLAKDLRGRTVTITMVSDAGASEEQWTSP
jgi:DsbC/DsbD-like thiol-disulfide interchange protein